MINSEAISDMNSVFLLSYSDTKNMIWKKGDTIFYKKGVTDPDYCVLKFTAICGRYYCDLNTEDFDIE